MWLISIGLILMGVANVWCPARGLCLALQREDDLHWRALGKPHGWQFQEPVKTFTLMSWILERGFEHSSSQRVQRLGALLFARVRVCRALMLSGAAMVVLGLTITL